ncbi:MAG: RNA polymerase sigma factor [bacterium]|nr:RNA polymerase sigma factor [bacterium]
MATEEVLWAYAEDLKQYAKYVCCTPENAEDVAQNTLLKAAEHIAQFRGESSLRTWLHTIATNECRMIQRRRQPDSLDSVYEEIASGARSDQSDVDMADPEELALEAETRREIVVALDRLPENYRRVLLLKDGCGLRSAEVADILDTTVPAVKSLLFRARRSLRESFEAA